MNMLRRIDWYGQMTLGALMIFSVPFLFLFGFGAGLFMLGCSEGVLTDWQLISAGLNTTSFLRAGFKKEITRYWKWVIIVGAVFFLTWPLSEIFDPADTVVIAYIAAGCSFVLAIYYMKIYNQMIDHFSLRKELSGFTKSKL